MTVLNNLEESALMQRLRGSKDNDVQALAVTVAHVAKQAAHLLGTVVVNMPLYTLHNELHILNVIAWMETILEPEGIKKLSPLECALSLLAAYTHDLGMTLSQKEFDSLDTNPEYQRFRDRYLEERHLITSLRASGNRHRANLIENHLLTEYLRDTHADRLSTRLCARLKDIAPDLIYKGVPYRRQLKLIAISHNHDVAWLRHQMEKEKLPIHTTIGSNEHVNFPFIGILLRLADIMDFDASRTPSILFRHFGLERELEDLTNNLKGPSASSLEWKKHLAITGTPWDPKTNVLTYSAAACTHPVVHKSILDFVGWIRREVSNSAGELRILNADDRLRLPTEVKAEITPVGYTYHDWHFRLDQDEIIRLLMGETLYGDPSLCIRELLQNALDAVELRDLRMQLRSKGGHPAGPVDGEQTQPGSFLLNGKKEPLAVELTWGEKDGHQFIRISDNGVGMTEKVIADYFTQIGKSFYRTPDFQAEQEEMRRHQLLLTPISTFGIGVLSCFMIAERLQVSTHPGAVSDSRPVLDLEISGPGKLFWTKPGTRTNQGTTITLWLRSELKGKEVVLEHEKDKCWERLRDFFYKRKSRKEQATLDPGLIAGQHVIWPKYPVRVVPPKGGEPWTIDDRFHVEHLAPIDPIRFQERLAEWGFPKDVASNPKWDLIDWTDDHGDKATGSRIRFWFPKESGATNPLSFWQLANLVGPQVRQVPPLVTVQSMGVSSQEEISPLLPFVPGVGVRAWIDLRGKAAPKLTADRSTALSPPDAEAWKSHVEAVWDRCAAKLATQSDHVPQVLWNYWITNLSANLKASLPTVSGNVMLIMAPALRQSWLFAMSSLAQDLNLDMAHHLYRDINSGRALGSGRDFSPDLTRDLAIARAQDVGLIGVSKQPITEVQLSLLATSFLQEAFFPNLSNSWPALGLQTLKGNIGDAILTAPAEFRFDLLGRTVLSMNKTGVECPELADYDLCFPMTAIPLGPLRQNFPDWRVDRRLCVLPFLLPGIAKPLKDKTKKLLPIGEIYAFQPDESLWFKPFDEWTPEDWQHKGHRSLLWDIKKATVLKAPGVHTRTEIRTIGKPFTKFD